MNRFTTIAAVAAGAIALAGCSTLEESIAEETADTFYANLTGA